MIILKIILAIIIIAACVGMIALIMELFTKSNGHKPYGPYEQFIKRGLDVFLATGALIVLSPVLLITAIMVRVKLGSPVIFTQDRPGKDEKIFKLYKFRSMTNAKDENGNLLPDEKRLTRYGKFLRSTSIDELPELINIIKGNMSIVGPRPLLVEYLPYYTEQERHRHDVRPGLTGLSQINGRNALNWDDRFRLDLQYIKSMSLKNDIKIFFHTVYNVIKRNDILVGESKVMNNLNVERSPNNNAIEKTRV